MRGIAQHEAARNLDDDAAVLDIMGQKIILTHDMMVEGVHFASHANPADIAWKLVAVNLSDLASKGARPMGVLLGFMLGDGQWDREFALGLKHALTQFNTPLLGGDTVRAGERESPRSFGMTAIGMVDGYEVPSRSGAQIGDDIFVTGHLGSAYAAYILQQAQKFCPDILLDALHRPNPQLKLGQLLAPHVGAMMDISDGLLLDAQRMAMASNICMKIDLGAVPLLREYISHMGDDVDARTRAASWGDDYQLLFTIKPSAAVKFMGQRPITKIGTCMAPHDGPLLLSMNGEAVQLPEKLGFSH
ncbi:thiamine-phosphate kinase [Sphingorhabdus lutea]|uniref:Thiamine-monophosphate kinase n=2 Tax=Sphingorhabdus lutea TaxID=1913578 RepID=A0A1L3JDE3_9SPHN|nr:thiamine-phosphate kinase [Sphingorhabdus lutea]